MTIAPRWSPSQCARTPGVHVPRKSRNPSPLLAPQPPMPPHPLPRRRSRRLRGQEPGEQCSRSSCQEDKEHEAKPASAQTQSEALVQVPELPGRYHSSSPEPCVWQRLWREWGRRFCIRLDLHGCFHTYPDVGGPFQSLPETYEAIDRYLEDRRDPKMCVEQDKAIRQCLYWPDGTIKRRTKSTEKSEMCQIVQALVDKHNEDHNLVEGRAHELKDVLQYMSICEKQKWYYHLNFTTKIKKAGPNECSMDNLFFVEAECVPQGKLKELRVNCFCTVNLNDNGQCYGCTRNGDVGMKHPISTGYTAGHLKVGLPFGCANWKRDYDDEDDDKYVKAREAELRQMFKGLEKPGVMKKLCTLPPWATKRKVLE